ncbi:MAG: polynucleotide adenylyltransferase PcnB [Myxococcota bacterium]
MSDDKPATGTERIFGHIDPDAMKVVRRLLQAGHEAYLVGGCVRDLYLGHSPKDFDVATSATPETIRKLFRNSRVIGRRFKLAHVFFGPKIIETSTFRAPPKQDDDDPLITHDNEWGSVEDDARRRDFTVNGLFYDVETRRIVDFVDGMDDLDRRVVRTIGEPELRFREDPVRMIRAIKFAARLDFQIDDETWRALLDVAPDIIRSSRARLLEEIYKLLRSGASRRCFEMLLETGMLHRIMPDYTRQFGKLDTGTAALRAGLDPTAILEQPWAVDDDPQPPQTMAPPEPAVDPEHTSEPFPLELDDAEPPVPSPTDDAELPADDADEARFANETRDPEILTTDTSELDAGAEPSVEPEPALTSDEAADIEDSDLTDPPPSDRAKPTADEARPRSGRSKRPPAGPPPAPLLWRYLDALDDYIQNTHEDVVNGVLQAVLFAPLVQHEMVEGSRQALDRAIENAMTPVGTSFGIARRDRELARQILMAHRRMTDRRRRRRGSLAQRQYFHDALIFLGISVRALGDGGSELSRWKALATAQINASHNERNTSGGRKRSRRRRGGRRGGKKPSSGGREAAPSREG